MTEPHTGAVSSADLRDRALQDLDAAPATTLTTSERERADATFARIVATPAPSGAPEPRRPAPRRWGRLLVPVALAGVAGATVPALLLGGSAFGSWTQVPEPLSGAARADAAASCRVGFGVRAGDGEVVVADERGGWTYVLLSGPRLEASCLMANDLVAGSASGPRRAGFMGGWTADPSPAPELAADGIVGHGAEGTMPVDRPWPLPDGEEWVASVEGFVGRDVAAVTVRTSDGPAVEASVEHGRFAAWWPSFEPSREHPDALAGLTYTVTLADGTTQQTTG